MLGSTTHRILAAVVTARARHAARQRSARGPAKGWPGKLVIAPIDIGPGDRAVALAAAVVARKLGTQVGAGPRRRADQQSAVARGRCRAAQPSAAASRDGAPDATSG